MIEPRRDHATRFKPKLDSLAKKPISVFLPKDVDAVVRSLPDRSRWLREAIMEKLKWEKLMQPNTASSKLQGKGDGNNTHDQPSLSIAERLRHRERAFVDGPPDLSERETRKKIAQSATDERFTARQD